MPEPWQCEGDFAKGGVGAGGSRTDASGAYPLPADEDVMTDGAIFGMLSGSDDQGPDEIARELGDHNR